MHPDAILAGRPKLEPDFAYVAALQERMRRLTPKGLRVLLVTNALKKYHERLVVSFFGGAPLEACDWWCAEYEARCGPVPAGRLRRVDRDAARAGSYDRIVSFDCNRDVLTLCAAHGCPGYFIGKLRQEHDADSRTCSSTLKLPLRHYSTQVGLGMAAQLDAFFGPGVWTAADGIDLPPAVPGHLALPEAIPVSVLIPGGGDRDYDFVLRHRDLLPAPIVIVHADPARADPAGRAALEQLRNDERFTVLPWMPSQRYLWLLLSSRVVVLRVHGEAEGDYACIADALWYGKPVIVNRVKATVHLHDRVTLYDRPEELSAALGDLEGRAAYQTTSARVREAARHQHDLFGLLVRVFEDL